MNVEFKELQQGPGLADYVNVVRRRVWYVVVPFVLCSVAAFGIAFLVPKEYKAITEIIVEDPDAAGGGAYAPVGITVPHKHLLSTISQDIRNFDFLRPLIAKHNITEGYNPANGREKRKLEERVRKRVEGLGTFQKVGPDWITFTYTGRDAVRVTEFTNAVRDKWKEDFMLRYGMAIEVIQNNIETVFKEANERYLKAAIELRNFQEENGSDYFGKDAGGAARLRLDKLKAELEEYETALQAEEATLKTQSDNLKKIDKLTTSDTSRKRNPEWIKQSALIEAGEARVRQMEKDFTDAWPAMRDARAQLAAEKAKLEKIEEFVTDSFTQDVSPLWVKLTNDQTDTQSEIAKLKKRIEKHKAAIEALDKSVLVIPEKAAQAQTLRDAVDTAFLQFEKANKAREVAKNTRDRMTKKSTTFFRTVVETAPEEAKFADPVYPNFALFAGVGAFLGLLIGGAIAFIGEFSAAAFTTPSQVRYMLQVPILGEVAPMITRYDVRKRSRNRRLLIATGMLILVVLLVIHLMWFDADWRANLPPFLRDLLRKTYGAR